MQRKKPVPVERVSSKFLAADYQLFGKLNSGFLNYFFFRCLNSEKTRVVQLKNIYLYDTVEAKIDVSLSSCIQRRDEQLVITRRVS